MNWIQDIIGTYAVLLLYTVFVGIVAAINVVLYHQLARFLSYRWVLGVFLREPSATFIAALVATTHFVLIVLSVLSNTL